MWQEMNLNTLELLGALVGLVYLWLEYRASIYLWLAGIVMPAIYIVVYYRAGLYADFGINIYYLGAALYGWCFWMYGRRRRPASGAATSSSATTAELPIGHTPQRYYLPLLAVGAAAFVAIAQILICWTDSDVPWLDSFTTALSFVGMWLLARKYVEQWLVWIAVDVVCCGLYVYKGLPFTATLYGLYAVIAIFGYLKWIQMMRTP